MDRLAATPQGAISRGPDLDRLERALRDLTERFVTQHDEAVKLRAEVEARDRRVGELEGELRRMQQSRREVAQRIDDLIGQIAALEGRLGTPAETP